MSTQPVITCREYICLCVFETGSYMENTGTSMSSKSDANMEHIDSLRSNDTIKITPQFSPHFKPKVADICIFPTERSYIFNSLISTA